MNSSIVIVALSGGVDSAVAGALVARSGRARAAFTLRLGDDAEAGAGRCCAPRDVRDARRVAAGLGLPHYVVDLRAQFASAVVDPFVDEYLAGRTPIPCVACNDRVKFVELVQRARALGAERLVTGHYARLRRDGGRMRLLRAVDPAKDQSYFLHGLDQEQLRAAEFPLGEMTKTRVRALARELGLVVAAKPESQEICFVPDGDTAAFVEAAARKRGRSPRPGPIVDRRGRKLGEHGGVHRFTVGQRRGLGAHGRPTYALELRAETATVVAGEAAELHAAALVAEPFHWIAGSPPATEPFVASVKVRHARADAPVRVIPDEEGGAVRMEFPSPHRAVAPGQAAVLYRGEEVLGGGPIRATATADGP